MHKIKSVTMAAILLASCHAIPASAATSYFQPMYDGDTFTLNQINADTGEVVDTKTFQLDVGVLPPADHSDPVVLEEQEKPADTEAPAPADTSGPAPDPVADTSPVTPAGDPDEVVVTGYWFHIGQGASDMVAKVCSYIGFDTVEACKKYAPVEEHSIEPSADDLPSVPAVQEEVPVVDEAAELPVIDPPAKQ